MGSHRVIAGLLGIAGIVSLGSCGDASTSTRPPTSPAAPAGGDTGPLTIGSTDQPQSRLLAEIYARALDARGIEVERVEDIGDRADYVAQVQTGRIDLVPEYTGVLLAYVQHQADPNAAETTAVDEQAATLADALPAALRVLTPSAAQDREVVVCTAAAAYTHAMTTLSELAAAAGEVHLGGPVSFRQRSPFGLVGFREIYSARFREFVELEPGEVARALASGGVDCAVVTSTSPITTDADIVTLTDDNGIVADEAVVPLIFVERATTALANAVNDVSAVLTTEALAAMMAEIERRHAEPAAVARRFVAVNDLG